ncbi:hypothetical protein M513_03039 [Trichuris suis]|uniref:Uncharacterized protein n=1 Tax=Trichuris suis TaxID=68888 RepID=A0A085MFB9_9BILA|nr:hypothetical protein M513_03039 [Trichuris suis]
MGQQGASSQDNRCCTPAEHFYSSIQLPAGRSVKYTHEIFHVAVRQTQPLLNLCYTNIPLISFHALGEEHPQLALADIAFIKEKRCTYMHNIPSWQRPTQILLNLPIRSPSPMLEMIGKPTIILRRKHRISSDLRS